MTNDAPKKKSNTGLLIALILIVSILCFIVASASSPNNRAPAFETYTAKLDCSDCAEENILVNLWNSPDRDYVTGKLPSGTTVTVIDRKFNSEEDRFYLKVKLGGESGWLPASFVTDN